MSELYHIKKKKNPFDETESKNISTFGSSISSMGKKAKNTIDRMQSSSDYQKVKLAQKVKKTNNDKKDSPISTFASSLSNAGSTVGRKITSSANKAKNIAAYYKTPYVSDEYQQELAYNSLKNMYPEEMNEPKKLRKKLNATKLKEIVGPRGRK